MEKILSVKSKCLRLPAQLYVELNQNVKLKHNVVNKILLSKRLLIDHVECLEFCLDELPSDESGSNIFNILNLSIAFATSSAINFIVLKPTFSTTTALYSASGIFGTLCGIKALHKYRNKCIGENLNRLIKSIDDFGNCIKRNISYFNEIQFMHVSEDDSTYRTRQKERAWDCIRSIKDATIILYDGTRRLEDQYKLSPKFSELYLPMEELRDCDYFKKEVTDYNSKNIKDFYNIFAYAQSQFFLRLALTTIEHNSTNFLCKDIESFTSHIEGYVRKEEEYFKKTSNDMQRKKKDAISCLYKSHDLHKIQYGPSSILKESSLKLSSGLIALAEECYKLDESLQNLSDEDQVKATETQNLIDLANSMRTIENSLSVCCDNFHRLMIVYNKFLGTKINEGSLEINEEEISEDKTTAPQLTTESCEQEKSDDFYAYMFDEHSEDTVDNCDADKSFETENQLLNLEEKITKKKFKPVLLQLKDKIDPIRQEMLEKERKVLEAKGVNVDKLFAVEHDGTENDEISSSGSEESLSTSRQSKPKKDNYEEMREFLAQKTAGNPAVNLFKLQLPTENIVTEDVLE